MIEKALIVIIACYAIGFMLVVAQYVYADPFGLTMVSWTGVPMRSALLGGGNGTTGVLQIGSFNTITANATSLTRTNTVNNPIGTAAGEAWDLITLMTGTYVFNVMYLILGGGDGAHNGVAAIIVAPFVSIYLILLGRAIIGYIRGISGDRLYAKLFQYQSKTNFILCVGHSMKNVLRMAFVKYQKSESYKVNDVISFIGKNNVKYCHRIIRIDNHYFTTQGDQLDKPQEYEIDLPISNIEGKVYWSYPNWNALSTSTV